MSIIVLALDPATSTGYCLVEVNVEDGYYTTACIYEYGFINVDITSNYQGDHCIDLMDKVQTLIDHHGVSKVTIEDFFFSKRFRNGSTVNVAFRTAIHILCRRNSIEYDIINISAWKTFICGRSTPTKEHKKLWGAEKAKKLYVQEALWHWYGFRFPNHSMSEKTGRPIVFKSDVVDVVAQAVYYCFMAFGIAEPTMPIKVPKDHIFKRVSKKDRSFSYPKRK